MPPHGGGHENIGKYISQEELNRISGVGAFAFNTIYKLVWLRENHPELLEKPMRGSSSPTCWPTSSPASWRQTGPWQGPPSSRIWKREIFRIHFELPRFEPRPLPPIVDAGETIGLLTPEAADAMNLPALAGIPVISAGHDTQFAISFRSRQEPARPFLRNMGNPDGALRTGQAGPGRL